MGLVPHQTEERLVTSPASTHMSPSQTKTSLQRRPPLVVQVKVSSHQCWKYTECTNSIFH